MLERPIRVLHLNTERGWRGGENQVFLLQRGMRELAADEVHMCTLCRQGEPLARRLADAGLAVLPVPVRGSLDPAVIRQICRFVGRHGVDILHAHTSHGHSLGLAASKLTGKPLIVTRRVDFAIKGGWKYGDGVARFVAISAGVRRVLLRAGVPGRAISLIPSGIDPQRFAVPAEDLRAAADLGSGPTCICVAALVPHKGHRHLLEAWRTVQEACSDANLVLVGDGEEATALRGLAEGLSVHFLGYRQDVPALLHSADCFAMTSVEEGLGTSIMDAMACGLPCIVTAAGGIPELIDDGVEGRLVPVGDVAAIAQALIGALRGADQRRRWSAAARQRAEGFHYHRMVEAYRALYREIRR